MDSHARPIALIGLSGAGKSAVARALGVRLACEVADLDADIEAAAGVPVIELFAREGEAGFRARECAALAAALAHARVIACGGGVVSSAAARTLLQDRCRVVWLEVEPDEALRRLGPGLANRPLLAGEAAAVRLEALLAERRGWYQTLAQVRIDTTGRTPEAIAAAVSTALDALAA